MTKPLSSRERMLEAFACREPDYTPCCFMIFNGLREKCRDQFEFVDRQLELGLDAFVEIPARPMKRDRSKTEHGDLRGLPVRFPPDVEVKDWREDRPGERYPILHREYRTPAGVLTTEVNKTEDWVHGDRVPLFDDFVIPRARKRLVTGPDDLPALKHLLAMPTDEEIAAFRAEAKQARAFAQKRGVIIAGQWGVLFDAACWLCGMEEISIAMLERPEFVEELFAIIAAWNRRRMEVILDEGVDLFIRRSWYETADFLSPSLYERFILPILKEDVRTAHAAGAKLGTIVTSSYTPLLDLYLESGIDVLIGQDPVQDARADFKLTKQKLGGKICLWGGVNGCVTVERGTPEQVRNEVRYAMETLAPGGGFILSPVDNVTQDDERTWTNIHALIDEWRRCR